MFALTTSNTFLLYSEPTDMRKSFDGLSGIVNTHFEMQATNGMVFIFVNKQRNKVKLLHWMVSLRQTTSSKIDNQQFLCDFYF